MITLEGKNAVAKLESKGYYIDNQFDGFTSTLSNEYELYKGEEIVMDHLSEAQVIALSNILQIEPSRATFPAESEEDMKKYRITAANKKHFDSLIRDYRENGFFLVTYGSRLAELEKDNEFIIIEF